MKNLNFKSLFVLIVLLFASFAFVSAQNLQERPNDEKNRPMELFRRLGLSREQIQEIRRINQEKQPLMREAQKRLGDANRDLDIAIYADTINETQIQTRLKEVQAAHDEVIKIRSSMEFAIRKVLTAEQLANFRQMREEMMRRNRERQMENREGPPKDRNNLPNRPPSDRPIQQRPQNRPNF